MTKHFFVNNRNQSRIDEEVRQIRQSSRAFTMNKKGNHIIINYDRVS